LPPGSEGRPPRGNPRGSNPDLLVLGSGRGAVPWGRTPPSPPCHPFPPTGGLRGGLGASRGTGFPPLGGSRQVGPPKGRNMGNQVPPYPPFGCFVNPRRRFPHHHPLNIPWGPDAQNPTWLSTRPRLPLLGCPYRVFDLPVGGVYHWASYQTYPTHPTTVSIPQPFFRVSVRLPLVPLGTQETTGQTPHTS
jgi:hypothetical protein